MKSLTSIYKSNNTIGSAKSKEKKSITKLASNASSFVNLNKSEVSKSSKVKGKDIKKNHSSALIKNEGRSSGMITEKAGDYAVI